MTSLQIFPFTTTVHLFCHVQNFAVMSSLKLEWEQIEISKLNYSVESFSVMVPEMWPLMGDNIFRWNQMDVIFKSLNRNYMNPGYFTLAATDLKS